MSQKRINLSLFQKAIFLVVVPLIFEVTIFGVCLGLYHEAQQKLAAAERSNKIQAQTDILKQEFYDAGYAFMAFDAKKNFPGVRERFHQSLARLPVGVEKLKRMVASNPKHKAIMDNLQEETEKARIWLTERERLSDNGEKLNVLEAIKERQHLELIVNNLTQIIDDEKPLQRGKPEALKLQHLVENLLFFGIVMSILIAGLMVWIFHRSTVGRLNSLMNNSVKLGRGQPLAPVLEGKDEIAMIDLVFHDAASALRELARRERAVIDNAVDVICSINAEGIFTSLSPAVFSLWGYPVEELSGRPWTEVICKDDLERSQKWMEELRTEKQSGELENRVIRDDGSLIDMLWTAHWSDKEQSLFCVAHDMTDRKELEKLKQQFVAMVSHDLRTPLSAVQTTLNLLGNDIWGALTEQGKNKVSMAEENLRHSIELINNLLDLEKMESGTMDLKQTQALLIPLFYRCVDAVTPLAEQRSIEITIPDGEVEVFVDERKLAQVLINLLGNALKFSPRDSQIDIDFKPEGSMVMITVKDQGAGIPADQVETVFERFHQTSVGKGVEGTGLGLAICKAIIEAHGGKIGATSEEGKGSTFWFTVPAAAQ